MRGKLVPTDLGGQMLLLNTPGAEILESSMSAVAGHAINRILHGVVPGGEPDLSFPRREIMLRGEIEW